MALIFRLSEIYFVNKYRNNINVEKYEKEILLAFVFGMITLSVFPQKKVSFWIMNHGKRF